MFRHALVASFALVLAACGGGGTKTSTDTDMAMVASAKCTMPTAPTCTTQQMSDLMLQSAVSPQSRTLTNTADGTGFTTELDASAGGFDPTESYVYAKFTATGLQKVQIDDAAAFTSLDWDIAFRRFIIRLNSGVSGPSCVDAARATTNDYEGLTAAPAGLTYNVEQYYTGDCTLVPDGSGLGSPGTVLQSFWSYTQCVQMSGNVFIIRLADGKSVKLTVTHYYTQSVQDVCDSTNTLSTSQDAAAAHVGVRWSYL